MNKERLNKVINSMILNDISQMVVSDPASIFYLTGKWFKPGERMLVLYLNITGNHKLFINNLFSVPEELGVEKVWFNDTKDPAEILSRYIDKKKKIGVDKYWTAQFLLRLMEEKGDSAFVNSSFIIDRLRMCKDKEEIELMQNSSRLNDMAMERLLKLIPKKYTEKQMAKCLTEIYEELGADGLAFDANVSYGINTSIAHYKPKNCELKEGDCITIDIGCVKDSYCSDMTRTVFYKHAGDRAKEIYKISLEATLAGTASVKPGVRFCDIDAAARGVIESAGLGKYFPNRTGHSIGLSVHDFGDVSSINTDVVQPGMIFSIEPSIKLPGEFGVMIEDLVLVTENGHEVLNNFNRELMIIE